MEIKFTDKELIECLRDELRIAGEVAETNIKMRHDLERQVAVMKAAVEHYANGENWELSDTRVGDYDLYRPSDDVMLTHGFDIAREALAKLIDVQESTQEDAVGSEI